MTLRLPACACWIVLLTALPAVLTGCDQSPVAAPGPEITATPPWRTAAFGDPANLGEQRTAVILAQFSNMMPPTRAPEVFQEAVFDAPNSLNAYVQDISYGQAWMTGYVYGWSAIDAIAPCNQWELTRQVIAHVDPSIDFRNFNHILIITPQVTTHFCYAAGNGTLGPIVLDTADGAISASVSHVIWEGYINLRLQPAARTLTHEFIHNLGMWHENGYNCGQVPVRHDGIGCTNVEYGNGFSLMGAGLHAFHPTAFAKEWIGWLPEAQILTATENGTYILAPLEMRGTAAKAIRIPLSRPLDVYAAPANPPVQATEYYLEFRRPIGFDALDPDDSSTQTQNLEGVFLYTWTLRPNTFTRFTEAKDEPITLLIDTTPGSLPDIPASAGPNDYSDALIPLGTVFHDEANGLRIEPLRIRLDNRIEVRISFE